MPGKGVKFTVGVAAIGGVAYVLMQLLMPLLQPLTAWLAAEMLVPFGIAYSQGALVFFKSLSVQVIPLCVGDIEIAVLAGAIASTADRTRKDRAFGMAAAFVFVMLVNALRIAATMLAWDAWGIAAVEAIHTILFKLVLVIAIVGFYAVWYLGDGIIRKAFPS